MRDSREPGVTGAMRGFFENQAAMSRPE
jgi:hypothetical protein